MLWVMGGLIDPIVVSVTMVSSVVSDERLCGLPIVISEGREGNGHNNNNGHTQ